jgi:3-phenylpropionate/cinnamic acid dioxygenase small subunit
MTSGAPVSEADYAAIRDFLFDEAALLDDRRYPDWLALLEPDISYRVAAHVVRAAGTGPKEVLVLDDRIADIEMRVKQLSTPNLTYAENPPPLFRRFVSNIRVKTGEQPNEYSTHSYLLMYRDGGTMPAPFVYSLVRRDTLRRIDGALRIAGRIAHLDQSIIGSANLSTFV